MAYWDVAQLAADQDFAQRCMAAYASEHSDSSTDPPTWWSRNAWGMAAAPGFGDKYASAVAGGVEHPGRDQSVISDADILSALQALPATGGAS
jgi:hypothetical protein